MRDSAYRRRGTRRFDDDEDSYEDKRYRHRLHRPLPETRDRADGLGDGERWSTWDQSSPTERGPRPYPAWLVTESAATDTELGILKTGKEADVFLVSRGVPGTDRFCLLAARGTGRPSTACSTVTSSTWRAGGSGNLGTPAPC